MYWYIDHISTSIGVGSTTRAQNKTTLVKCVHYLIKNFQNNLVEGVIDEEKEGSVELHHLAGTHPEDEGGGGRRGLRASLRDLE